MTTPTEKVKCQRACKFCRKSHTTCEDTRPCQRCIKRDIAQLCIQDETDQLQQQAAQHAQQQMAAAAAAAAGVGPDQQQQHTSQQPGGLGNGVPRSTIPNKRRGFSMSSYEENGGDDRSGAGPGSNSTPSPVRAAASDMIQPVPLPSIMASPQAGFRTMPPFTADDMQPSPMGAAGASRGPGVPQWYDASTLQQAFDKMDTLPGSVQAPPPGVTGSGATPEFSWSALVEGMLQDTAAGGPGGHAGTPGDFAWLNVHANGAGGSGSTPPVGLQHMLQGAQQQQAQGSSSGGGGPHSNSNTSNLSPGAMESALSPTNVMSPGQAIPGPNEPVEPFNYTFSYSRLRSFANEMGNAEFKRCVSATTERFKPVLHGKLSTYTGDELVQSEVQFLSYVRAWQSFCDTIPVPACVWRRTGEIYAANARFLHMLDLKPELIRKAKLATYMVLDPPSFMDYWDEYAAQVLTNLAGRTSFDMVLPVGFAKHGGVKRTHLLTACMSFDTFGLPMAATVLFTPLQVPPPKAAGGRPPGIPGMHGASPSGEPTIDVQVGGTASDPVME